jgi:hypothetical protein
LNNNKGLEMLIAKGILVDESVMIPGVNDQHGRSQQGC